MSDELLINRVMKGRRVDRNGALSDVRISDGGTGWPTPDDEIVFRLKLAHSELVIKPHGDTSSRIYWQS